MSKNKAYLLKISFLFLLMFMILSISCSTPGGSSNGGSGGGTTPPASTNEINVKAGTDIASGGIYDFGSTTTGTSSSAVTFTIENTGTVDLTITSIALTGTDADQFFLNDTTISPVAGSGSTTFTVTFLPTSVGSKSAKLTIVNDDADEGSYEINLIGTGTTSSVVSEIAVFAGRKEYNNNGTYNFCPQIQGTPVTTKFTIKNIGTADLTISNIVLSDTVNFQLISNPPPIISWDNINDTNEGTFSVRFNPSSAGTYNATIVMSNNDNDENPFTLNISGVSYNTVSDYEINLNFIHDTLPSGSGPIVYACWIEDENGNFIQNIYVCNKLKGNTLTGIAIPKWKTTTYPLDVDTVSGATVTNNLDYTADLKDVSKKFRVYFEVDHSKNGNIYFIDRPSFIYQSDLIDVGSLNTGGYVLNIIGWMSNDTTGSPYGQQPKVTIAGFERYKLMEGSANLAYIQDYLYMKNTLKVTVTRK